MNDHSSNTAARTDPPMESRRHTDQQYERELTALREKLLFMGAKVEEALADAMRAFEQKDIVLAQRVIDQDREINRLEIAIDGDCLSLLARRAPVASDLRFLTMTLKIVTDLERIGDIAVNIGERVVGFAADPPRLTWPAVTQMGITVRSMLKDALDAFVAADVAKARWVIEQDRSVDSAYASVFHEVLLVMMEDRSAVQRGMGIQAIAKYLERVGDHATNLAEFVVFLAKGTDIRHLQAGIEEAGEGS